MTSTLEASATEHVAFGPFVYDRNNRLLWRDDTQVPLPPRAVGVLGLLLDRPGQLISKQDLISAVWPDAFVTETSLAEAVSFVRQALADDSQNPTYIQTLHRRGYRFIADVRRVDARSAVSGALREAATEASADVARAPVEASEPRLSLLAPWLVTLFALVVAIVAVWRFTHTAVPASRTPVRFEIALPRGLSVPASGAPIAVSHDGKAIAFSACGSESGCAIFLRPLSQPDATEIAGTAGATAPFFSPDGRWLGYFAAGQLQKIALAGGSPIPLAPVPHALGATWTMDDRIVFAGSTDGGLSVVPANGGASRVLTQAGEGTEHQWPTALPSGDTVVFTVASKADGRARTYAGIASLETGAWGRLMDDVAAVRVALDGYLLASRGTDLIGVAFDARSRSVAGTPASVAPRAPYDSQGPRFAAAAVGMLVVAPPGSAVLDVILDWGDELRRLVPAPQPPLPR